MPETAYAPDPRGSPNLTVLSRRLDCDCPFSAELLSGLIHYWKLEEASGNSRADSVGSTTLVETGGVVASAPGKHGNAAEFDFVTDHFLASSSALTTTLPMTLAFWTNQSSPAVGASLAITFLDDGGNGLIECILQGSGNLIFSEESSGSTINATLGTIGVWHLVVFVIPSSGALKASIDGAPFSTGANVTGAGVGIGTWRIGSAGGETLDGLMDEMAIWSRVLSQSEVTSLWNSGNGRFLA